MDKTRLLHLKHLYSRAAFGLDPAELMLKKDWNTSHAVDNLFKESASVRPLSLPLVSPPRKTFQNLTEEEKKMLLRQSRQGVRTLNTTWLLQLATAREQLREKMTLFWHGHFACRSTNANFLQQLNNIHREHALGNFRTLLLEVSRTPAMLQFLNNQQNRKDHPNENFARELMELFTLGRGNYTEQDVKEAARAFTGWGYNRLGEFQFRKLVHDYGVKTFFGSTGNYGGEEIIEIILKKPQTAIYLARKIYAFFVSDQPDETRIEELGKYFYEQDYNISSLLKRMFTSDWFYHQKNIGNKIKSPVELLAGITRQFGVRFQNPAILLQFQKALGQVLFFPPNVAGWSGGRNWIDSSSLMVRLKLPSLILNGGIIEFEGKADPEEEAAIAMERMKKKLVNRRVQATVDWPHFSRSFKSESIGLEELLLNCPIPDKLKETFNQETDLKSKAIAIVSLPEYQLG